jgi:hypothetical protein
MSQPTLAPLDCTTCEHPITHHDAGECWTTPDGQETHDETSCSCAWYEPADADAFANYSESMYENEALATGRYDELGL